MRFLACSPLPLTVADFVVTGCTFRLEWASSSDPTMSSATQEALSKLILAYQGATNSNVSSQNLSLTSCASKHRSSTLLVQCWNLSLNREF